MNENLSKLGSQLAAIWKQLGAAQRVSVIVASLAVLGTLLGITMWSSRVDYGLLYGKLSDSESARVIAALDEAKVPYRIGSGGSSISVPSDKVHVTRMQLAGKGIPRGDGVGFEIFDKPNFGISDFVQRANYTRAVQGELARTISQIDEVESARVMVVQPENRLLVDKEKHPTASVFVRVRGNALLQPQSINSIRFLVANAVEGLQANYVTVIDNMGNVLSENVENDSLVGLTTTQLGARRNLELYLSKKAETMLERVLGRGQALVRVAAEINYDTLTRTEEKFDPDGQVVKTQTKNEESTDSTTTSFRDQVGVSANNPQDTTTTTPPGMEPAKGSGSQDSPFTSTRNKKTTGNIEYEISRTTSNLMQAAGGLKRLTAAVTIAARYEGAGAERKLVPRTTEEMDKLRRVVQSALGIEQGNTRNDQVTLEELPFNDQLATEVTKQLETQERTELWWTIGKTALYPGIALIFLFVLVRLFKRTRVDEIPIGIPIGQIAGSHNGNGHRFDWQHKNGGNVTVDVLNQLVKEQPDNMSQAIRDWLERGKDGRK